MKKDPTMNDARPAPFVPPEVDLRGYEWMQLYGDRLFNSETWILASAEGKVAALALWWNSFAHEVPAGSLPNNERLLAAAAGYGVAVAAWKAIREEALRGFVECSDGRLYHPFVAELALQAWEVRRAEIARKEAERARKKAKRLTEKGDVSTGQGGVVRRTEGECPPDTGEVSGGTSAGIPPENALRGQERRGQEVKNSESPAGGPRARPREEPARPPPDDPGSGVPATAVTAIRSGVSASFERWYDLYDRPFSPADEELFEAWLAAGAERGLSPDATAAAVIDEVQRQFERLERGGKGPPRSLRAMLDGDVRAAIGRAPKSGKLAADGAPGARAESDERVKWRARLEGWKRQRLWLPSWGPKPGEPGCEAPADLVAEVLGGLVGEPV